MRKFSEFRQEAQKLAEEVQPIQEVVAGGDVSLAGDARVGPMDGPMAADDVDTGAHNLQDPASLERVNGFVQAIGAKPYMNPYYAVNRLWTQLQAIGVSFDVNAAKFAQDSGVVELPLTQFGSRYGFSDMDGVVKKDDGISGRVPGGLKLVIHYVKTKGLTTLEANIEQGALPASLLALGEDNIATEKITVNGQDYNVKSKAPSKNDKKNTEVVATSANNKTSQVRVTLDPKNAVKNMKREPVKTDVNEEVGGDFSDLKSWKAEAGHRQLLVRKGVHPSGSVQDYYTAKDRQGNHRGHFDVTTNKGELHEDGMPWDSVEDPMGGVKG